MTFDDLQVINGENQKVFFYTDKLGKVYMDTLFAIQFANSAVVFPIYDIQEFAPVNYYSTKDILAGIMVFNQVVLNPFELLGLQRLEDEYIYYIDKVEIAFIDKDVSTIEQFNQCRIKGKAELNGVYITFPQITMTADSSPLSLVSRFVANEHKIFKQGGEK